jgi:molybdopterin synthase sulfur carrier subunit
MTRIRVELPSHLWRLAALPSHTVQLHVSRPTLRAVLDALEASYPALRGTIRNQTTGERRAFLRFFADEQDISMLDMDADLPDAVVRGDQPLIIIGAIAGGSAAR